MTVEKKNDMLRIRCRTSTRKRFKKLVALMEFDSYEEALLWMMDLAEKSVEFRQKTARIPLV